MARKSVKEREKEYLEKHNKTNDIAEIAPRVYEKALIVKAYERFENKYAKNNIHYENNVLMFDVLNMNEFNAIKEDICGEYERIGFSIGCRIVPEIVEHKYTEDNKLDSRYR